MAISAQGSGTLNRLAVSLLFHEGERPKVADILSLAGEQGEFAVSLDPDSQGNGGEDERHWLELLAWGLTFDLAGLAPATGEAVPEPRQKLSLNDLGDARLEAISLRPGPHLSGSVGILPVARTLAWLGAKLSQLDGARAVCWHPAGCWSEPGVYRDGIARWVEGGVFPGLMLTSLHSAPDGGLQSEGLAALTGQELRLEPELVGDRAGGMKLAMRLLDFLIVQGRVCGMDRITGPDGSPLRLEPSDNGLFVRVSRG